MGFYRGDSAAYAVEVELTEALPWWDFNEVKPQDGKVMPLSAGAVDEDCYYLAIHETWRHDVEPGKPVHIGPYSAADEPYLTWDGLLVAAAEELKLAIVGQPAWMVLPDES